jgi:ketosteroid isomerase-like protein
MPKEKLEIARQLSEAIESGDEEALFALYDPAIVWDQRAGPTELVGVYEGHEGVRQFWEQWREPFEILQVHAEELIDAGTTSLLGSE